MNDEELIEELLNDPTITFEEAVRMANARVESGRAGSKSPSEAARPAQRRRGEQSRLAGCEALVPA